MTNYLIYELDNLEAFITAMIDIEEQSKEFNENNIEMTYKPKLTPFKDMYLIEVAITDDSRK